MKTHADRLFEGFCALRGIECQSFSVADGKHPDYEIVLSGQRVVVEVKVLEPNDEERVVNERRARAEIVAGGGKPGERLRREIRPANAQLKAFLAGRKLPTMLVVFNNSGCSIHTRDYSVMTAMQGYDEIPVMVPTDPAESSTFGAARSGRHERAMRPNANTSTSAIAILHDLEAQDIQLVVYHNRFASVPLEPAILRIQGVAQRRLPDDVASSLEAPWAEA